MWIAISAFFAVLPLINGEIYCYCNQAACVTTGYMCKAASACFSDLQSGVHGCLDRRRRCHSLLCCKEDMCNYVHLDVYLGTHKEQLSSTFDSPPQEDSNKVTMVDSTLQRELWFKAAVIAVPIGGMCILVLLVIIAARMLRQDTMRQRRLLELRRIYGHSLRDNLLPWSKEKNNTIV